MSVEGPNSLPGQLNNPDLYLELIARSQKKHRLLSIHWEMTYRCNERCTHCYLDVLPAGAGVVGELTTAECKRVLDELAAEGVLNVAFTGGEVLLRNDWYEILAYARQLGFALRIFTNATLITPEAADLIASLHPFFVEVSLYALDAATHDDITQVPGSFERTMRGIHLLLDLKVRVKIKTPLMRENVY